MPGTAFDDQAAAPHQSPGLVADIALDHDLAAAQLLPDLVEPVGRPFDPNMGRVAPAQAKDIGDRDPFASGLQLELADLGRRLPGQAMGHQRRQIEPLLRTGPHDQHERLHGSRSLR